jgi:hypothetical protein
VQKMPGVGLFFPIWNGSNPNSAAVARPGAEPLPGSSP